MQEQIEQIEQKKSKEQIEQKKSLKKYPSPRFFRKVPKLYLYAIPEYKELNLNERRNRFRR